MLVIPSHLDRVLLMVGSPGRYHVLVAFLLCCMQFPVSFSDHLLTFYTVTPRHRCRAHPNLTLGDFELRPIVNDNGRRKYSDCELYVDPLDHFKGTKPCDDGSEFLVPQGHSSVVTEWELVCEKASLATMLPYVTAVATMIGSLSSGLLADKYGRKYILLFSLVFHTCFGVFLHFLPLYGMFVTVFSIQGILISSIQCVSYLLLVENLPTEWQWKATLVIAVFQCTGHMILASLTWLVRNWRYIQLVISAPGVVVIGYFWLLPRSIAWLVSENRQLSAQHQLSRFCHSPSASLSSNLRMQLLKSCRAAFSTPGSFAARHAFETVVCSSRLRMLAFVQYFVWFVVSLLSRCSTEEVSVLRENIYSRLFIFGVLELSFVIILFLSCNRVGLKLTQATALTICGICCIFSAIVEHQVLQMRFSFASEKGFHHLAPVLALLGQSIARSLFMCLWMYAAKTFSTGVRGLGLGSCMLCGKLACLFIPDIDRLAASSRYTVLGLGGALSVIAGLLTTWLLPDCTYRPLPTIAEEIEVGRTKIINDSDLDFQDTSLTSGFNATMRNDVDSPIHLLSVHNHELSSKNLLSRLLTILQKKTRWRFKTERDPSSNVVATLSCPKQVQQLSVVVDSDVFEPVTGFVFKWDKDEPAVKISDFEKEMSVYWKPSSDPNDKTIGDKHLNSLNILYNVQTSCLGELHDTSV